MIMKLIHIIELWTSPFLDLDLYLIFFTIVFFWKCFMSYFTVVFYVQFCLGVFYSRCFLSRYFFSMCFIVDTPSIVLMYYIVIHKFFIGSDRLEFKIFKTFTIGSSSKPYFGQNFQIFMILQSFYLFCSEEFIK